MLGYKEFSQVVTHTAGSAISLLGMTAHLGRGAGRLAVSAALGGRGALPRHVGDLDPATMSTLMGHSVTSLSVLGDDAGTSSRARLKLTGEGVPPSVFVKMAALTLGTRMLGELASLGETEVNFYTQLAPELGAAVPGTYGACFDPWTGRFVLVLEDLATRNTRFPDTVHPLDVDEGHLLVAALAGVHAKYFGRLPVKRGGPGPLGWLWLASAYPSAPLAGPIMQRSLSRMLEQDTSIAVQDGTYIVENYQAVMRRIDAPPHTVLHGDTHPGNLFFCDGAAGLLDWQMVRRGHPMRDMAYALIFGLTTEDRRAHQRDLLDHYREAFTAAGGPDLEHDDIWPRYQQAAAYAFTSSLSTAGLGGMQSEDIALMGLERAVAALGDLDTVAALQRG